VCLALPGFTIDYKITMTKTKKVSRVKDTPPDERVQLYRVTSKNWNGTLELVQVSETDFQFFLNGEPRYFGRHFKWGQVLGKIEFLRSCGANLEPMQRELKAFVPAAKDETLPSGTMCHPLQECGYCLQAILPQIFERNQAAAMAARRRKTEIRTDRRKANQGNKATQFKARVIDSLNYPNLGLHIPPSKGVADLIFLLPW
jgi:hypothetical protein